MGIIVYVYIIKKGGGPMKQIGLFLSFVFLIFISITGWSNWIVSRNPLRFSFSGRHDAVCFLIFLAFAFVASGVIVLFFNLYLFFFE